MEEPCDVSSRGSVAGGRERRVRQKLHLLRQCQRPAAARSATDWLPLPASDAADPSLPIVDGSLTRSPTSSLPLRVQPWLLRTPDLQGMRGASLLLKSATDPEKIAGLGIIGAQPARDAGRISGVVALEFATPEAALAAQPTLLRYLTDELPGVEWEGWWCEAASYAAAESARRAGAGGGNQRLRAPSSGPPSFTPARAPARANANPPGRTPRHRTCQKT